MSMKLHTPSLVEPVEDTIIVGGLLRKKVLRVGFDEDEYDLCDQGSQNMWANEKTGSDWNNGMVNDDSDPRKAKASAY